MKTIPLSREQLAALSNPVRLRIHACLRVQGRATARELAERLGMDELKLYYHLRLLERLQLIVASERPGATRPAAAYHLAGRFKVESLDLDDPANRDAVSRNLESLLRTAAKEYRQAVQLRRNAIYEDTLVSRSVVRISKANQRELQRKLKELVGWLDGVSDDQGSPASLTAVLTPLPGPEIETES